MQLKGTEGGRYLSGDNQTTASSILSVLSTSSKPLRYLADHSVMGSFSLQQYFANIENKVGSWLFLSTKPSARELTLPLIAALSELAFCQLMNIGINRQRRVWFVIDELSSLGKMPALAGLMAEGRKYGACVLAGLQSLNQLYTHYGQYEGSTIFGQFGTNCFFRNNEPAIAKMVSNMCGNQIINRQQKNISFGANELRDGISYHETQQKKDLVEYSDLASLAVGQCYALLPEPQVRISKLQTVEVQKKDKNIGFVQQVEKNDALFTSQSKQPQNIEETEAMEQEEEATSAGGDVVQSVSAFSPFPVKEQEASEELATELPLNPSPKNVLDKF
jgi:type IV secretory pathway TraG/TraD family ATPase VirD4